MQHALSRAALLCIFPAFVAACSDDGSDAGPNRPGGNGGSGASSGGSSGSNGSGGSASGAAGVGAAGGVAGTGGGTGSGAGGSAGDAGSGGSAGVGGGSGGSSGASGSGTGGTAGSGGAAGSGGVPPFKDPGTGPWTPVPDGEKAAQCKLDPALLQTANSRIGTAYAVIRYGKLCHEYVPSGRDAPADEVARRSGGGNRRL